MDPLISMDKIEVILKQDIPQTEEGISIKEIVQAVIKGKWLISIIVILSLIITYFGINLTTPYSGKAKMLIAFNFDGIEKGVDPYGKVFDVSRIKAPLILEEVVKNLELNKYGISADYIRRNIDIIPIIPGNIVQKIKNLETARTQNIQDQQDFTYYPNEYEVTFYISKESGLSNTKGQEVLREVVKEYEKYFFKSYSDREVLANAIGDLSYEEYDYPEVSRVIQNQIDIIQNYLTAKGNEKEASDFRSKETGLSFQDISESVNIIDNVDISRMDSIIGAFNLTKDKEKLIRLYEYYIKQDELTSAKKNDESKIASDMLKKFQKDKNALIIPGLTSNDLSGTQLELDEKDTYYDKLADRATNAGVEAKDASHDAKYYKNELERLKNDNVAEDVKKVAEKDVIRIIKGIKERLEKWIGLTNKTVAEYYETNLYNKAINKLSPVEIYPGVEKRSMVLGISLLFGLVIGLFIVLLRDYFRRIGALKGIDIQK